MRQQRRLDECLNRLHQASLNGVPGSQRVDGSECLLRAAAADQATDPAHDRHLTLQQVGQPARHIEDYLSKRLAPVPLVASVHVGHGLPAAKDVGDPGLLLLTSVPAVLDAPQGGLPMVLDLGGGGGSRAAAGRAERSRRSGGVAAARRAARGRCRLNALPQRRLCRNPCAGVGGAGSLDALHSQQEHPILFVPTLLPVTQIDVVRLVRRIVFNDDANTASGPLAVRLLGRALFVLDQNLHPVVNLWSSPALRQAGLGLERTAGDLCEEVLSGGQPAVHLVVEVAGEA
mmetsp:Transcript_129287/g.374355  ORF Transcript_129287/g.374355 Transcript_129287/m.374355 type:complete len:288 (+) Transcript_129287:347-1210(+)